MSETLEQRIRNVARQDFEMGMVTHFASDMVEILDERDRQIVALKAMLKYVEFEVVSETCPVCGGNQTHDTACVLAAFLYPEKAESYERGTGDTHINEMLWYVENDGDFEFLREVKE